MDLRLLRYFTAVADEGSLTKGAAKLNMSQPPLSTQLKHFEDELGVKLFERTPHGIKLTQAGHYLRSRAYEIFSLVEQTEIILQKMGDTDSNRLSIGCVPTISEMYLSEWLSNFKERYPDVDFHIYEGDTNAILHLIDSGNVDIGVVRMPIDEDKYTYGVLSREETYAAINEKNPLCELARDDSIDFSQILKAKLILPTRQQAILPLPDSAQSKLNVPQHFAGASDGAERYRGQHRSAERQEAVYRQEHTVFPHRESNVYIDGGSGMAQRYPLVAYGGAVYENVPVKHGWQGPGRKDKTQ